MVTIRGHYAENLAAVLPSTLSHPTGFLGFQEISRICTVPGTARVRSSHPYPEPFPAPLLPKLPHGVRGCALLVGAGGAICRAARAPRQSLRTGVWRRPHPRARRQLRGRAALIRCRPDCGARAAPSPRRAPAGAASVCLQPGGYREPLRCSPRARPAPPRTATASPQSPRYAGHCRFHQDGLCVEQLEKSGYSLYFSNACLRLTGTPGPDSAIVHHFTCGTYACFIPKSWLLGGVNLLCQKSKWMVFDVFSFSIFFYPPPPPLCFLVVRLVF